jgi:hypothetical protein
MPGPTTGSQQGACSDCRCAHSPPTHLKVLSTSKPFAERGLPPLDERQRNRRLGKLGIAIRSM